jgi:hypothetical protein
MVIGFETKQLRQLCESQKLLEGKFGVQVASVVRARLADFQSATSLFEILNLGLLKKVDHPVDGVIKLHGHGLDMVLKPILKGQAGGSLADHQFITQVKVMSLEPSNA